MIRRGDDRGAVLIVVALFVVVAVVMLAAVIDLGGLRQEKRELTMSTDAAALAAVQTVNFSLLTGSTDCATALTMPTVALQEGLVTAKDVVLKSLNDNGGSTYLTCTVVPDGAGSGYVTVKATEDVEYTFGKAVGQNSGSVDGTSSAAFTLDLGGGLRPVGVCQETDSLDAVSLNLGTQLVALAGLPAAPQGSPYISATLPVDKLDDDSTCGEAPGHFGQMDFEDDGSGHGNCDPTKPDKLVAGTYCEYLYNGWYGDLPSDHVYSGDTGDDYKNTTDMFDNLKDSVGHFFIPVYSEVVDCKQKAKPAECDNIKGTPFRVTYYVEVELDSYCLVGNAKPDCRIEKDLDGDGTIKPAEQLRWMKFDVYRVVDASSVTALPKTDDAEEIPARICATDEDLSYC